jgi:phenylacetic acid degradation operon negative regulatory protein
VLEILQSTGTHDKVVVIQGRSLGALASRPLQELVRECWNLDTIAADYKRFSDCFRPLVRAIKAASELDPEQAFCVRSLLIHEFRRVQLRDPQLPRQLLPAEWPGDNARQICRELYTLVRAQSEQHLTNLLETADGRLPEAAPYFELRFRDATTGEVEVAA